MLWTILIGFVIGVIAKWLMPGDDPKGFIITTLLGIGGSWVGSMLFGHRVGLFGSVIGAVLLLLAYRWLNNKK